MFRKAYLAGVLVMALSGAWLVNDSIPREGALVTSLTLYFLGVVAGLGVILSGAAYELLVEARNG